MRVPPMSCGVWRRMYSGKSRRYCVSSSTRVRLPAKVFIHNRAVDQVTRAAHELLRPSGRLIIQVPNAACWQFLLLGASWNGVDVPRHLYDFRPADLDRMLDSCGFEVLRRKYFSLRDNPAGLATSLAPSLEPVARRVLQTKESSIERLAKDLLYAVLVAASLPFTLVEAACRAGSTIMIEARKKT